MMTDREIIDKANELAHLFYNQHGNQRPAEFKFYEATHPQEMLMWRLASDAMSYLLDTDPDEVLAAFEESDG